MTAPLHRRYPPSWRRDAAAVAEALFATAASPPPAARIDWLIDDLEHFLLVCQPRPRLLFRAALATLVTAGPLLVGSLTPLARLPLDTRIRALTRLSDPRTGPLSLAAFAVKTLLCFIWFEHPDVQTAAGLDPSPQHPRSHA